MWKHKYPTIVSDNLHINAENLKTLRKPLGLTLEVFFIQFLNLFWQITENVVSVIDNLIERSEDTEVERNPKPIKVSPRFVEILERQVTNLQQNGSNFTIERQNFRIKGLHIPEQTFTDKTTISLGKEFSQDATGDDNVNITFPEGLLQTLVKGGKENVN